ncbi:hypothetical protein ACFWB2_31835 [Streptomyces virginiae]|uniref:hypothetical protein n=1 Tax=Streptomyces virginiae TaxID=1961 RepID=UPI003677E075
MSTPTLHPPNPALVADAPQLPEGLTIAATVRLLTARPGPLQRAGGPLVPLLRPGHYAGLVAMQRLGEVKGEKRPRLDVRVRWMDDRGEVHDDGPRRLHLLHHLKTASGPAGSWTCGWWLPFKGHGAAWRPMAHAISRVRPRT